MSLSTLLGLSSRRGLLRIHKDLWGLRNYLIALPSGFLKEVYLTAYYATLDKKGSLISHVAENEGPPVFPHGISGVFISGASKIGKNAVIFHKVTIGSNRLEDSDNTGAPTIGNNFYVGAGAKVIGNIKLGDSCRVGANCVVVEDMPPHSVAVLPKSRILIRENLDNRFFRKRNGVRSYYDDGSWISVEDSN